ncbi:hypothetical protein ICC28_08495 [Streptomyces sp. TRM68416]|nr:DUF6153 family protein [Streptomyces sp. TRM68416]MBD0838736.1 hypothetical protein [Streptomyces sp. TRM68416]
MRTVTAPAQLRRAPSPLGWWRALLVLGLLAGLFGMHALAPGNAVAAGGHHSAASAHTAAPMAHADGSGHGDHGAPAAHDEYVCHSDTGTGGHTQHADATCVSGAVGAGPVLPALVADPVGPVSRAERGLAARGASGEGRAPPTLAELQLLRI